MSTFQLSQADIDEEARLYSKRVDKLNLIREKFEQYKEIKKNVKELRRQLKDSQKNYSGNNQKTCEFIRAKRLGPIPKSKTLWNPPPIPSLN